MRNEEKRMNIPLIIMIIVLGFGIWLGNSYIAYESKEVILSEVCCGNDTIIYNTVGEYLDYIEICNTTAKAIDISGYCLSDDQDNLKKYIFPEGTILESEEYHLHQLNNLVLNHPLMIKLYHIHCFPLFHKYSHLNYQHY